MSNTTAISFWKFISQHSIEIPIIQRDYAQGRIGREELRKKFLENIKEALDNNSGNILKLDFVYGAETNCKLNPLDGQQRLTTLWLLHWYIALCTDKLKNPEVANTLKKFTYQTRISSREFCEQLCKIENFKNFNKADNNKDEKENKKNKAVDFITKQNWFYSIWKMDPTIASMLRMLKGTTTKDKNDNDFTDGIEELFKDEKDLTKYWDILVSDNCPIVFYHLPLKDFGLSDDLYIKMNARGKQLTCFENFKADLIGHIRKLDNTNNIYLDAKNGIPTKIDNTWTDIFWKRRSADNKIDDIYFAFINRLFWNELFIAKDNNKYILDIGKGDENSTQEYNNISYKYLTDDSKIKYEGLEKYKYFNSEIPLYFFEVLTNVLDNYSELIKSNIDIPECKWNKTFKFIPEYEEDKVTSLNQVQRIAFFALCKYLKEYKKDTDNNTSLKRWMRVVWNLISGEDQNGRPEIRSTSAMRTAIEFIDSLDCYNIYESFAKCDIKGNSAFDERCKEEKEKITKILNCNPTIDSYPWENKIIEAENYAFFKGSIKFLFTNAEGKFNWDNFNTKWENIKILIPEDTQEHNLIESVLPYLSNDDIKNIFSKCNLSNNEGNLKFLLTAFPDKLHNFLMQENKQIELSLLQIDLMLLSKEAPLYRIHEKWNFGLDVLSDYSSRSGYYEFKSYFIGSENIRLNLLKEVKEITIENKIIENKNKTHSVIKGLFINFKYTYNQKEYLFRWETNDYIELYINNWEDKLGDENLRTKFNDSNEKSHFKDAQELIDELNKCCNAYENIINGQ